MQTGIKRKISKLDKDQQIFELEKMMRSENFKSENINDWDGVQIRIKKSNMKRCLMLTQKGRPSQE